MDQHKLQELIENLIDTEQYESIKQLFCDIPERDENVQLLQEVDIEFTRNVCFKHLTEYNYTNRIARYTCAEELLKLIASNAPIEEMLIELLELIEEPNAKYNFTAIIRTMQIILLRLKDRKPPALEWVFDGILNRLSNLPIPEYLSNSYDLDKWRLIEQDESVQNLLIHYGIVTLFYEPLLSDILATHQHQAFRDCGITRRNIMCCFLIRLLGKPLSLLNITQEGELCETHAMKYCVELTQNIMKCMVDPLFFLNIIKKRYMWRGAQQCDIRTNMYLAQETLPSDALAIFMYMVFAEDIATDNIPLVYNHLYIFEGMLYCIIELLEQKEPVLHNIGVTLGLKMLRKSSAPRLGYDCFDVRAHQHFCEVLCAIICYSPIFILRRDGLRLLFEYIFKFEDRGQYVLLKNLIHHVNYMPISGHLICFYKDLVAKKLNDASIEKLPLVYSGVYFQRMMLNSFYNLPAGVETDLISYSDFIISGLNALLYFIIMDRKNRTGIWNFMDIIKKIYINNVRVAVNMTEAHIIEEQKSLKESHEKNKSYKEKKEMELLTHVRIANSPPQDKLESLMCTDQKIAQLNKSLSTLHIMQCVLGRLDDALLARAPNL